MKAIDLTKILKGYTSGWVALSADYKKVIVWASSLKVLNRKLEKMGNPRVVLLPGMRSYGPLIGGNN
ncbi:MAG: hypothetical protein HY376_00060 [Candidatus Blackburnbacteria bacterium]|nr:hypothetical protein [Candidatus Blackburnbacteria bacterium]